MKLRMILASAGCAAVLFLGRPARADSVRADWNHNIDFANFHTYSWGKVEVSNPFNSDRIEGAINQDLEKKGWHEVPTGGQITITVRDRIHDEKQLETYYDGLGGGWGMGWGWGGWRWSGWSPGGFGESTTTTKNTPEDHMVIDMFDAQNKQLIWRGISQGEVNNNSNKNSQMIYQDIGKLLYSFPPKEKK